MPGLIGPRSIGSLWGVQTLGLGSGLRYAVGLFRVCGGFESRPLGGVAFGLAGRALG